MQKKRSINIGGKHSANTSSRGREAHGRGDPELSGLPRPAKSGGARNDDRILTIGGLICLIILVYLIDGILLESEMLPFSINAVYSTLNHWVKHWHVLVIGLLPVYVALAFFGAVLIGTFFGTRLQHWATRFWKH